MLRAGIKVSMSGGPINEFKKNGIILKKLLLFKISPITLEF
jgi:hypothetical protein